MLGSLLCAIARRVLRIPILRYVDDFFAPERRGSASVAMNQFARMVRACLGQTAISEKKLESGNPLNILGVTVFIEHDKGKADKHVCVA